MARVRALQARLLPHGWFDLVRQVLLFFLAYNGYRLVRGVADDPGVTAAAFDHARSLIGIEKGLHVFIEPAVNGWANGTLVGDVSSWLYINAQTSVTIGCLAFLYLFHNRSFYFVRTCSWSPWASRSSATRCSRPPRRGSFPSGASRTPCRASPASAMTT